VAERKPFLLRLAPEVYDVLQKWAADDLRSLNGQIEFLLRRALDEAGREPRRTGAAGPAARPGPRRPPPGASPRRERPDRDP
jgi:hypothetical protein